MVPERRGNPSSKLIELVFAHLKSTAEHPKAPLIYLAGGPGGSSTGFANDPQALDNWLNVLHRGIRRTSETPRRGANVEDNPESWNVYDSLGEAYKDAGNSARAIELYERSLELNPNNTNAVRMLKQLGAR